MTTKNQSKTILITGATKGIGRATTERLSNKGYQVIGVARHQPDLKFPGIFYAADLSNEKITREVFLEINHQYKVDGLVNNVGVALPQSLEDITIHDFRLCFDINLRSMLQAMQIFTPKMIERQWGRVVNIASRAVLGLAGRSVYSASKSALVAFTRSWALELARTGIVVNAIAPGPVETETFRLHRPKGSEEEQSSLQNVPMGRFGNPDEIAAAIQFFLSEDAGFITGQTLFVDGGASIGRYIV